MDVRIVAILVGVAITFIIQNGLDARWYVSVSAGVVGYVVAHLIGWAINAHKRHSQAKQRDPLTMHLILINSTARGRCAAAAAPVRRRFGI